MPKTFTPDELQAIGARLVALIGASAAMGHVSPSSTVMYVDPGDDLATQVVLTAFGACVFGAAGNEDRQALAGLVDEYGLLDLIAEAVTR